MSCPSIPLASDRGSGPSDPCTDLDDHITDKPSDKIDNSHRARTIKNALAVIHRQFEKIVKAEAAADGEAVPGWVLRDSRGVLKAYGHPAFVSAAKKSDLSRLLDEELEDYDKPPPLSSGPFLKRLGPDWREKKTWRAGGLRQLVTDTLSAAFGNRRVLFEEANRPNWWPAKLPFASPSGPKAYGVEGTAEFRECLVSIVEAAYRGHGEPLDPPPLSLSSSPRPAPPQTPRAPSGPALDDSRTPMGLAGPRPSQASDSPYAVATGPAASAQRAGQLGGGSEVLAIEEPTSVKPLPSQSSPPPSRPPPKVPRKEPRGAPQVEAVSGAVAAPESSVPLESADHVATDDLILRVVRVIRAECGDELGANNPPAALAVTHHTEQAPFLRLPNTTTRALQIHHQASPEHWLVSGLAEGGVFVWDSARLRESAAVRREVAGLYGDVAGNRDGVVHVRHFNPILQRGGAVCGFLASAFAIDAAQGLLPHQRLYGQAAAKAAVLDVLRTGRLKPCSAPRTRPAEPWKEYLVSSHCCGASGGGEAMAACDDCGRWWHIKAACLPFLRPAERALFVRSQGLDDDLPFVCCDESSPPPSPATSHQDIFQDY